MFDPQQFGKRLRFLRESRGLTQEALSQELHIGANQEYRLESGRRSPTTDMCLQLSEFFDVTLDFVIAGYEKPSITARETLLEVIAMLSELEKQINKSSSILEE